MTIADIEEYNAFGPWIADVTSVEEVPRAFRAFTADLDAASLALKIPRDIARRDARPGMDLFDRLLIVDRERLTVLNRTGDDVVPQTVPLTSIAAFEDSVDLLDGRLLLHSALGVVDVPYNGSSRAQIRRLIDALRRPSESAAPRAASGGALTDLGLADVALGGEFLELQRSEPASALLAAHGRRIVAPPSGLLSSIGHRFRPGTLHATVVFTVRDELHVLHRRAQLTRGGKPTLSSAHTIVVRDAIRSVDVRTHEVYPEVSVVRIELAASTIELLVPAGSAAEGALRGLA